MPTIPSTALPTPFLTRRQTIGGLAALAGIGSARAQVERPLRFILPFAAGSGVDTIARSSSNALAKALGQPVVIENQPGAGGVVGTAAMVRAAPDGQTLSFVSNNHVIYPSVIKSLPFDPVNDITPIAIMGNTPLVLVVNPSVPAKNAKELVALLKANPGKFNYASSGNGTILHLATEMFKAVTNTFVTHIPYRGVGPMMTDIISGQVAMGTLALPAIQAHLKSGALRAIGMPSAQRSAAAPDIPTFAEQGYPTYLVDGWFAVIGPKGLSTAQVERVHGALTTAFNTPEVKDSMAHQGNIIAISTPQSASAFFRSELVKYATLVKRAGLVAE